MKQLLYNYIVIFLLFFSSTFYCQNIQNSQKKLYICFNENSKEYYLKKGENGTSIKERIYLKNTKANGDIQFFINGVMFTYDASKMEKIYWEKTKKMDNFLSPEEVKNHVQTIQKKYPLGYKYPSKEYPAMFIVDKSNSDKIIIYEVKWQYYSE